MIVRFINPAIEEDSDQWGCSDDDIFWVECTYTEAREKIIPLLKGDSITATEKQTEQNKFYKLSFSDFICEIDFLVSRTLDVPKPTVLRYPVHQMWNAYSPFYIFPKVEITNLNELAQLHPLYSQAEKIGI